MNESVSPQRRRPPGWRAARRAPDEQDEQTGEGLAQQPGQGVRPDTAFERGETVERPAVRLPVADQPDDGPDEDPDDDHPVFGARRDDDRTRTVPAVGPDLYGDRPAAGPQATEDRAADGFDDEDDDEDDSWDGEDESSAAGRPVAVPLAGFFTGMAYILGLPVLYVWLSDPDSIADAVGVDLAWLLAAILVPVFLTAIPQTRTFGRYMLLGVGLSALVVVGVAAVVLAVLIFLV